MLFKYEVQWYYHAVDFWMPLGGLHITRYGAAKRALKCYLASSHTAHHWRVVDHSTQKIILEIRANEVL